MLEGEAERCCRKVHFETRGWLRQNVFEVGALPRAPLGELKALPQTPHYVDLMEGNREGNGKGLGKEREWNEKERKERGRREGNGN